MSVRTSVLGRAGAYLRWLRTGRLPFLAAAFTAVHVEPHARDVAVRYVLALDDWDGRPLELLVRVVTATTGLCIGESSRSVSRSSFGERVKLGGLGGPSVVVPLVAELSDPGRLKVVVELLLLDGDEVLARAAPTRVRLVPRNRRARSKPNAPARSRHRAPSPPPPPRRSPAEALLDLESPYTQAELKAAFRRAVRHSHPDRCARESPDRRRAAAERTRAIIDAYHTLRRELARSA